MGEQIKLKPLVMEVQVANLDETLKKLKSLICEINDLTNGKLFQIID